MRDRRLNINTPPMSILFHTTLLGGVWREERGQIINIRHFRNVINIVVINSIVIYRMKDLNKTRYYNSDNL